MSKNTPEYLDISDITHQLYAFIYEEKIKNKWLSSPGFNIYVRISKRLVNNGNHKIKPFQLETLDIANISIDPHLQGQGYFTKIISYLENTNSFPLYIENVLEKRFQNFFEKRGYIKQKTLESSIKTDYPVSYLYF